MDNIPPNFGGFLEPPISDGRNFLDHYFANIYSKLEADALLFNRELPHSGLVGSENENAIADVIRNFLPKRFGVEVNAIVIDRFDKASRQADIVIYDAEQPTYLRKVFPVEMVYAVIEVKTSLTKTEATSALDNLASVSELEFRPALTPYWQTQTKKQDLHHSPPSLYVFAYRTSCSSFETFANWFTYDFLSRGVSLKSKAPTYPESRGLIVCALDQGIISMGSTNRYIKRWMAVAGDSDAPHTFKTSLLGQPQDVDPAKSLYFFLQDLWFDLENHKLHPGFDIRSYTSKVLSSILVIEDEHISPQQES